MEQAGAQQQQQATATTARRGKKGTKRQQRVPPFNPTKRIEDALSAEDGPAWWLDVMCPTVADMRELRKLLPLHPLTMEDILHQETREKIESFSTLGYYFIVFRALDETYFRYTEAEPSPPGSPGGPSPMSSSSSSSGGGGGGGGEKGKGGVSFAPMATGDTSLEDSLEKTSTEEALGGGRRLPGGWSRKPSGFAEDFEMTDLGGGGGGGGGAATAGGGGGGGGGGAGLLGGDGPGRKKGRVDIIEVGTKEGVEGVGLGAVNMYLVVFGDGILSFHFEDISKHAERVQGKLQQVGLSRTMSSHWIAYGLMDSIVDAFFPLIDFIVTESNEVDNFLSNPTTPSQTKLHSDPSVVSLSSTGVVKRSLPREAVPNAIESVLSVLVSASWIERLRAAGYLSKRVVVEQVFAEDVLIGGKDFDRLAMLKRIADARKLVTGLSRLLGTKSDVVRGLRKRTKEGVLVGAREGEGRDIAIYLGDLFDHIVTMQQSLTFYDAILSQDHPAYLGILRLALTSAKAGTDMALVKLYIVTLTFLPINILTGIFSGNEKVPRNGSADGNVRADGTVGPPKIFFMILGGVVVTALCTWYAIWLIFQSSKKAAKKRGSPVG